MILYVINFETLMLYEKLSISTCKQIFVRGVKMKKLAKFKQEQLSWLQNAKKLKHLERLSTILLFVGAAVFGAGYYLDEFWSLCIPSFVILSLSIILSDYQ